MERGGWMGIYRVKGGHDREGGGLDMERGGWMGIYRVKGGHDREGGGLDMERGGWMGIYRVKGGHDREGGSLDMERGGWMGIYRVKGGHDREGGGLDMERGGWMGIYRVKGGHDREGGGLDMERGGWMGIYRGFGTGTLKKLFKYKCGSSPTTGQCHNSDSMPWLALYHATTYHSHAIHSATHRGGLLVIPVPEDAHLKRSRLEVEEFGCGWEDGYNGGVPGYADGVCGLDGKGGGGHGSEVKWQGLHRYEVVGGWV